MKTEKLHRAGKRFYHNFGLKFLSLLFAVILWSFVISQTNPSRAKTIVDIPISVNGLSALNAQGLTTREDLVSSPLKATVKVNVAHSDYRFVNQNMISASIDLSKITAEGSSNIPISVSFDNIGDVSLVSVEPKAANITIDRLVSKDIPVKLETSGTLKEGLVSVYPSYPETVAVKGSAYYVEKIEKAVVSVALDNLNDGDTCYSLCRFTDGTGNLINLPGQRISVDMDIQTVKEVSVDLSSAVINKDKVASGYTFNGITATNVKICAHKEILQSISSVSPKPIDVSGKDSTFSSAELEFDLPDGVTLFEGSSSSAKIDIIHKQQTKKVSRTINVSGIPQGKTVTVSNGNVTRKISSDGTVNITATVVLTGPEALLNGITANDVIVRISLVNKTDGTYEMVPVVALSSSIASGVTASLESPGQLTVTIK